ncbi:MAG: hypothetical protein ABIL45_04360 [candidate division WOR-3 bacterium]
MKIKIYDKDSKKETNLNPIKQKLKDIIQKSKIIIISEREDVEITLSVLGQNYTLKLNPLDIVKANEFKFKKFKIRRIEPNVYELTWEKDSIDNFDTLKLASYVAPIKNVKEIYLELPDNEVSVDKLKMYAAIIAVILLLLIFLAIRGLMK